MRKFVIGDIHGGLRALKQVLDRADVRLEDQLIFLGDYVDGWSESPQVLDFLIELSNRQTCFFLRGNHDELLLDWLKGKDNELWHQHGGESTIEGYSKLSSDHKQKHIVFLETLLDYYIDDGNRLFVHAGFTNLHGVKHEYFSRLLYWERTLWETALALNPELSIADSAYPKRFKVYKEVFIGHTPVTRIGENTPQNRANIWNIDTGAAFKGKLSILDIDSKMFWQSDALTDIYPGEKGRN